MKEQNINEKLEICKKCPIYAKARGICNSNLWLNPQTDEVSSSPRAGFIRGCGCFLQVKTKNPNSHCVAGKW